MRFAKLFVASMAVLLVLVAVELAVKETKTTSASSRIVIGSATRAGIRLPDGTKVVVYRKGSGRDNGIWTMNSDGTNQVHILKEFYSHSKYFYPGWLSNSQIVCFRVGSGSEEPGKDIMIVNSDGSLDRKLSIKNQWLEELGCSADGSMIMFGWVRFEEGLLPVFPAVIEVAIGRIFDWPVNNKQTRNADWINLP